MLGRRRGKDLILNKEDFKMDYDSFTWILIQQYWDAYGTITEENETFYDENGCLKKIDSKYSNERT